MENQTNAPQQQTIIVVGRPKSVAVAFVLAFFFGPIGLLYASVAGGIIMMVLGVIIGIFTLGIGLIVAWVASVIWAVVAANMANKKLNNATNR